MAADAEVKLNFTAQVEQARAAIEEVAAAMERLQSSGGVMRAEDAELLNEMQGQLVAYKARLDELSAAYQRLQLGGGQANEQALAQIKELQEEVANLTKQQDGLLKKVIDLQVENNKLKGKEDEATEGEKDMTAAQRVMSETGQHAYTTLRGAVGGFIKSLFAGKLAVRELGVALKGLMYSTVVLGAIQLAMEGIMWAWGGIKSLFGQSEEQMKAAEEAAQRAREELDEARAEAERAAGEVQRLKDKLAEKEEAETLKETLAGITAEYVAQRDAVNDTLAALREQAQVKARERALEAAQRTGELDMELLDLEERFASGDVGKRDYIAQKAEIEKRKRDEARVAEVDSAEIAAEAAEAERDRVSAELDAANEEILRLEGELAKMTSPEEAEIEQAKVEELEAKLEQFKREPAVYNPETGFNDYYSEIFARMDEIETQKGVAAAAAKRAKQYQEVAHRLDEERKTAAGLEKTAKAAEDGARRANDALGATLRRTAMEGGQDDRLTDKRVQMQLAAVGRDEAAKQERAEKARLKNRVSELLQDARTAAGTKGDTEDDAAAFRAISDFIKQQGDEVAQYGVNVKALIAVCDKLNLGANSSKSRISALEREIKALQRKVDRTNSQQ